MGEACTLGCTTLPCLKKLTWLEEPFKTMFKVRLHSVGGKVWEGWAQCNISAHITACAADSGNGHLNLILASSCSRQSCAFVAVPF